MAEQQQQTAKQDKAKAAAQKKAKKQQKAKADQAARNEFELVRIRHFFYRDNYRRLVGLLLVLGVICFALSAVIYYMYTHRPAPVYIATSSTGQVTKLEDLRSPVLSDEELLIWVQRAASRAFTFNYVQYREQLQMAKDTYFTESGGKAYLDALEESRDLEAMKEGKLIVTAAPQGAPTFLRKPQIVNGRFSWDVKIPIKVTFQNPGYANSVQMDLQMRIIRTSYLVDRVTNIDGAKGIGINQFLVDEATRYGRI